MINSRLISVPIWALTIGVDAVELYNKEQAFHMTEHGRCSTHSHKGK